VYHGHLFVTGRVQGGLKFKMGIDPAIIQNVVQNVRAEVIPRAPSIKLDPAIIQKIATRVPIFSGMSQPCLMSTLAMAEHIPVKAGEAVFRDGDLGNSFYVLIAGDVLVEKLLEGKSVELARFGPGECFGEMALVGNDVRSATVRTLNDVVAMRFYRDQIDANPESAHIIYRNISRILAARLAESSMMLAELAARQKAQLPPS
jgi:CRP/FNR family transcriptional regulator, cyclic AMP receptor protein